MNKGDDVLKTFQAEVQEIDKNYRFYFEAVFEIDYDECAEALDSMALDLVKFVTSPATFVPDVARPPTKQLIDEINKRVGKSKTKKRVLVSVFLGRVMLRNIVALAEAGELPQAISALAAAAMANGELRALNSEVENKASTGRKTAAKRKAHYDKQSEEALARWRSELSPDLSATAAAERLRAMGVSISLGKLMRIISAEKQGGAAKQEPKASSKAKVVRLKSVV